MNWLHRLARNRLWDWAVLAIALFTVARLAAVLPQRWRQNDFAHYYVTSRLYWAGQNPFRTELEPEYARYGLEYEPTVPTGTNPPAWLALFGAVAWLPARAAFWVWVALQCVALAALLWVSRQLLGDRLSRRGWYLFVCGVIASAPVFWHFWFSQLQLLLAALIAGAFFCLRRERGTAAVILATGAALVKLYPAILWPWFVRRAGKDGRERAQYVVESAILAVTVIALTRPVWWLDVFTHGVPALAADALARSFNFNLPSYLATVVHLFAGLPIGVSWTLGTACGLAFIVWAYWRCRGDVELEFALLTVAMVAGSPKASGTYFIWLVWPVLCSAVRVAARPTLGRLFWLGMVLVLLNIHATIANDWLDRHLAVKVLVNYLPLYGLLGLGVLLVREAAGGRE